ncbi:ASCH domain-containing protein [Levilactobacillus fuyuanensis]|uniref:ASCH domain-containing protein n=1 Tax=Levilactobacillus fuyuanensis TaxID=2486022 RepID=A0ABW4H250_9LACO|nr:ASCH domain-containing protein [Levilactobacillus fuyuanensis]
MKMGLNSDQFELVFMETKTIEIRLNDEKRRRLHVGDSICFYNVADETQQLVRRVKSLRQFSTFADLYSQYSPESVGSAPEDDVAQMVADTYTIYTPEQEKQWGVLAIGI